MVALLPQSFCSIVDRVSLVIVVAVDNMERSFSWNDSERLINAQPTAIEKLFLEK